nr:uncharacterized protein LOC101417488 [Dasypus novemcinctus]
MEAKSTAPPSTSQGCQSPVEAGALPLSPGARGPLSLQPPPSLASPDAKTLAREGMPVAQIVHLNSLIDAATKGLENSPSGGGIRPEGRQPAVTEPCLQRRTPSPRMETRYYMDRQQVTRPGWASLFNR